jgi:hypothetical protein
MTELAKENFTANKFAAHSLTSYRCRPIDSDAV